MGLFGDGEGGDGDDGGVNHWGAYYAVFAFFEAGDWDCNEAADATEDAVRIAWIAPIAVHMFPPRATPTPIEQATSAMPDAIFANLQEKLREAVKVLWPTVGKGSKE